MGMLMIAAILAALVAALCLAAPLVVSFILVARKKFRVVGFIVLGLYAILVGSLVISAKFHRRDTSGRILRFCMGAGLYQQQGEDRVEDLQHSSALPRLQEWAVKTLDRFRSGQVATNGEASYWSLGDIQIAGSEVPQFVSTEWKEREASRGVHQIVS